MGTPKHSQLEARNELTMSTPLQFSPSHYVCNSGAHRPCPLNTYKSSKGFTHQRRPPSLFFFLSFFLALSPAWHSPSQTVYHCTQHDQLHVRCMETCFVVEDFSQKWCRTCLFILEGDSEIVSQGKTLLGWRKSTSSVSNSKWHK